MKAIEIIKAMCYDSALAEYSQTVSYEEEMPRKEWLKENFDAHLVGQRVEAGEYLCIYAVHTNEVYPFLVNTPDIILERNEAEEYPEDDRLIYLYKID